MKKTFSMLLVFVFLFTVVFAMSIHGATKSINVKVNGQLLKLDTPLIKEKTKDLISTKAIFDKMGVKMTYDKKTAQYIATRGATVVRFKANSTTINVNGKNLTLDTPVRVKNGKIYVPIKFLIVGFGVTSAWDQKTYSIVLQDKVLVQPKPVVTPQVTDSYPQLREAMTKALTYKGEFKMLTNMTIDMGALGKTAINMDMQGAMNNQDLKMTGNLEFGDLMPSMKVDLVKIGTATYTNVNDEGWIKEDVYDLPVDTDQTIMANKAFLEKYKTLIVKKQDAVVVNGEKTTKYTITITKDLLQQLMTDDTTTSAETVAMLKDTTINSCFADIYVNANNEIVKQYIKFDYAMKVQDTRINSLMVIDALFTNIGKDIPITPPTME